MSKINQALKQYGLRASYQEALAEIEEESVVDVLDRVEKDLGITPPEPEAAHE